MKYTDDLAKTALISICIPVFNHKPYIERAVRSALNQDYPHFEVVICDDNSTDGSWDLLVSIEDSRLRLFRNTTNLGAAVNHNLAVKHARGEFIKFLPPDDELLPDAISSMAPWLDRFPSAIAVVGGCEYIDTQSSFLGASPCVDSVKFVNGGSMIRQIMKKGNIIGNPGFPLLRKAAYERVKGMRECLSYIWDFDLWVRLCRLGDWIFLPRIVFRNRAENECSISSQLTDWDKMLTLFREEFLVAQYEAENYVKWHFGEKEMSRWMGRMGGRHLAVGAYRLIRYYNPRLLQCILKEHLSRGLLLESSRFFWTHQFHVLVRNLIVKLLKGIPWTMKPGRHLDVKGSAVLPLDRG